MRSTSGAAGKVPVTNGAVPPTSATAAASTFGERGEATRRAAQQVALELFTTRGYEATSLRQIADRLGINKASLYYYFPSKEAVLRSLFEERGSEAEDLLAWLREQPPGPDLVVVAVLRWVDTFTEDKLRGIRFLDANPLAVQNLTTASGAGTTEATTTDSAAKIGDSLSQFADAMVEMLPAQDGEQAVLLRMAVLSINAAVRAAVGTTAGDDAIIGAAHRAATALMREVTGHLPPTGGR